MSLPGGDVQQLTNGDDPCLAPGASFDGREIALHCFRDGVRQLFTMPAEGGSLAQVTTEKTHSRIGNWSPDGRSIVFVRHAVSPDQETAIVTRDQSGHWGAPRTLLKGGGSGIWSPDGTKIVTQMATGDGKFVVVVVPAGGGTPTIVSKPHQRADGGIGWAFSRDSKTVYYFIQPPAEERTGIWRAPATGGPSQPVAWYDGVPGGFTRSVLRVHGDHIYLNIGDPESDVWVTEIQGER
jgi:hypothetical protein